MIFQLRSGTRIRRRISLFKKQWFCIFFEVMAMEKAVVAIVGRPNVGKSTLFNRIIRKREAIVDDTAGITRDRKYADADWEGVPFTLVDTGGFIPRSQDVIESGVTSQVRVAIEEADFLLYLVDGTSGITDVDGEMADILRKGRKPYLLVVNKMDNERRTPDAAEFIRLGLGEPVLISALGGIGIGDLLSSVIARLDLPEPVDETGEETGVRLAVVGRPNVGKSTFVNTVLGQERVLVTEIPGTTRDPVDVRIRFGGHDFVLIDTAGMRRRSRVKEGVEFYSALRTHRALQRCDVACVFVDASEGMTQQDMRVLKEVTDARKGVVVAVNKWDTIQDDEYRIHWFEEDIRHKLQGLTYVPVITISCTQGLRVEEVLETAHEVYLERQKRVSSPDLNRLLEEIGRNHPPPSVQGKRVRILYGTQVGTGPPRFVFFSKYPELIKKSYHRFVENRLRDRFGFEGVPVVLSFRKKK